MKAMKQTALYNLSGQAIPDNATVAISGDYKSGDALVIESFDGTTGTANWRTDAEVKTRRAQRKQAASKPNSHQPWPPPLKPKVPYS
jgi:hypothetical protein